MAKDFEIEVPISAKGSTSSGTSGGGNPMVKELQKLNKSTKNLNKTMFMNIDVIEIITSLFGDVLKVIQPLIKILSLLFLMIFLPLLPVLKLLVKGLSKLVKMFSGGSGNVAKLVSKTILGIFAAVGLLLLSATAPVWIVFALIAATVLLLWEPIMASLAWIGSFLGELAANLWIGLVDLVNVIAKFGTFIWEKLNAGLAKVAKFGLLIWDKFKLGLESVVNFGTWVWDLFKTGLSGIADLGTKIWNWIKDSLGSVGSFFGGSSEDDFLMRPGQSPVSFSPQDTIVGVKDISKLGGSTININNPVVRNDQDIKKIANEVSRVLQRQMPGRFST